LQDRLVKELRLAGISDLEAANAFLPGFVESYNSKFARPPADDLDLHRPLEGRNDLGDILCMRRLSRTSASARYWPGAKSSRMPGLFRRALRQNPAARPRRRV
jgi:hypothetical protein